MIQTQLTQKRHWNTTECEWDESGSASKRRCLPGNSNRTHDDDHRWLLECTHEQNQSHSNHSIGAIRGHSQVQQDVNALSTGLDGSNDISKQPHQQSVTHSVANDLQHQLNHITFDASGGQLNFDEDINRQVQNAIDSILNLQSNDSEAALHFSLDQSFLADSPQTMQRPPSSNKRKYHHINRMDDISDCLGSVMDESSDNAVTHNLHQQQPHLQNHFNHVLYQTHNHQQPQHHNAHSQHHQAQTQGPSAVEGGAGSSTTGDGRVSAADLPVKTIIKS